MNTPRESQKYSNNALQIVFYIGKIIQSVYFTHNTRPGLEDYLVRGGGEGEGLHHISYMITNTIQ